MISFVKVLRCKVDDVEQTVNEHGLDGWRFHHFRHSPNGRDAVVVVLRDHRDEEDARQYWRVRSVELDELARVREAEAEEQRLKKAAHEKRMAEEKAAKAARLVDAARSGVAPTTTLATGAVLRPRGNR